MFPEKQHVEDLPDSIKEFQQEKLGPNIDLKKKQREISFTALIFFL